MDIRGLAPMLYVFDMPTSIHFYRDLLGFELVTTSQPGDIYGWALLRLNGVELMLNTAYDDDQRPPAPDPARVSAHGDTALYFACEDLDAAYRHLLAHGINVKADHRVLRNETVVGYRSRWFQSVLPMAGHSADSRAVDGPVRP
jgi:glyoxylase I family protein